MGARKPLYYFNVLKSEAACNWQIEESRVCACKRVYQILSKASSIIIVIHLLDSRQRSTWRHGSLALHAPTQVFFTQFISFQRGERAESTVTGGAQARAFVFRCKLSHNLALAFISAGQQVSLTESGVGRIDKGQQRAKLRQGCHCHLPCPRCFRCYGFRCWRWTRYARF